MKKSYWGISALILIVLITGLSLLNWQKFPFFLDIYYHLNAMRGFATAGGIVTHSFWELAPEGTVNVYPPLFHILLLIPYKLGFNALFIARSFSVASFILLLSTLYFVVSRLFSKKLGFFVVTAACIPYTFFLKSTITIPATLSLIFILWAFFAIENNRKIAAPMLLAASFYTHLGLPWLGIFTFLIYGALRREKMRPILRAVFLSIALSLPIFTHLLANFDKFESLLGIRALENELFEFYPVIYLFAIVGLLRLRNKIVRDRGLFFVALFIGLLPMAINYRFRLISAEGLLPVVFFAGLGLEKGYDSLRDFFKAKSVDPLTVGFYFSCLFIFINFFSPTISLYNTPIPPFEKKELKFYLRDSTVTNLLPIYKRHLRPLEISLYNHEAEHWIELIEKKTAPDDIICSNYSYVGGMLSAFSGRANGARLFYEIKEPAHPVYEIGSSKLVVWLLEPDGHFSDGLRKCLEKYKFRKAAITESAAILLQDNAPKSKPVKPILPAKAAFLILLLCSLLIYFDLARPRNKFNNLSRSSLE
ncbi:MAG: hypothetical protein Q8R05_08310 [Candidatus Omnitrophota bacterium]|nr:hypothetical protein [Candidatus Omnitrophota bacterium]